MGRPRAPKQQLRIDWGDLLNKHSVTLVKLGGAGFLACLGYFIYAIYWGIPQSGTDPVRALGLITAFGQGLVLSSVVLSVGLVLLTLEELAYAVIVAVGAVALMLGIPYLVASNLGQVPSSLQRVTQALSQSATQAGVAALMVVGCRVVYEIYVQLKDAPERRRIRLEKEAATQDGVLKKHKTLKPTTVFSPCWELPFCHERIREICPAYKARKPCWRYGIGCNCDPKMIESLIRMGSPGKGPKSTERANREGAYIRSDLEADVAFSTKAERTIPCAKCPIYTEHQRLKFKFVNPVAIGATVIAMGILYVPITKAWGALAGGIVRVARQITLNSGFNAGEWFEYLRGPTVQTFFFIFVCLMALSYTLKLTEWLILQKKL